MPPCDLKTGCLETYFSNGHETAHRSHRPPKVSHPRRRTFSGDGGRHKRTKKDDVTDSCRLAVPVANGMTDKQREEAWHSRMEIAVGQTEKGREESASAACAVAAVEWDSPDAMATQTQ